MVILSFKVSHDSVTDRRLRRWDNKRLQSDNTLVFSEWAFQTLKCSGGLQHVQADISGIWTRFLSFPKWNANWWRWGVMVGWILKTFVASRAWPFFHSGIHDSATSIWILKMKTVMSIVTGREEQRCPCFVHRDTACNTNSFCFKQRKLLWWNLKVASYKWETL